jgi:hypothetical protein
MTRARGTAPPSSLAEGHASVSMISGVRSSSEVDNAGDACYSKTISNSGIAGSESGESSEAERGAVLDCSSCAHSPRQLVERDSKRSRQPRNAAKRAHASFDLLGDSAFSNKPAAGNADKEVRCRIVVL